jgi:hypothetical protein
VTSSTSAKLRLDTGVLIEQVHEPARPPVCLSLPGLLQLGTQRCGELLAGLLQPVFRDLGVPGITVA